MWNAKHLSEVQPDFVSKTSFLWVHQNSLQILADQKTLVGVEHNWDKNCSEIVIEDITNHEKGIPPIRIKQHENQINNILLDEKNCCMFSGDDNGRVIQSYLDLQDNPGKVLKDYGKLGVGVIYSSIMLGDVAVFGGWNGTLGFIDSQKREHLKNKFDMAPGVCLLYTSPSPRDLSTSRMPSSA